MSRPRNAESVFRAIADPKRRRIIELLTADERTVGDLMGVMKIKKASMSYHLGVLIQADLVRQRRTGTFMKCGVNNAALAEAEAWIVRHARPKARTKTT